MRLQEVVARAVIEMGKNGKEKLAIAADLSFNTVNNVLKGQSILPQNAYKLAKACGCTDEEALSLSSDQARTAS